MNDNPSIEESDRLKALGLAVIKNEAAAVLGLSSRITDEFVRACRFMLACKGRIVVTGMGKSGHICGKIAATLASTGSPAFFVHPGEASHGDLGMITDKDVVLALSNSGETRELLTIIPIIKRLGIPLIALTGDSASNLALEADVHIDVGVAQEACPLNLAPTSSTTAALAMGDALAIALLEARGFTEQDFARSHPGGSLGRRLLLHISDIMHSGAEIPAVAAEAHLKDALVEMTKKGLGMTAIVDGDNHLAGIYTDGDLRRTLDQEIDLNRSLVRDFMTRDCKTATSNLLAAEALQIMQQNKINALLIVNQEHQLIGAINMHDLLRAGVV
ncbi:MAG: KpsF/GutQ family sugar-phosphate isomerase [Gammaproteobacteria bacterium]|nr:KpsF/GutQ family sugar-phosphate isomerase [Gammaproteobacteria bacterium]MCP5406422.1 KpsF/GutQ family sugar-phosphate isomerase [Chromatiaceae bacterium]MCP5408090.1 KpsF/GutQ family sugar-phosphate isomerase [Chromatiaceae bacterium]MCP5442989.1 KpsF/GutQ family sugar-phosphate isomerase [Chromatiaceae bacterium]